MGWALHYIEKLNRGESVAFRPRGNSMVGKIESGQLCTVVPVDAAELAVGDIVLCKVGRAPGGCAAMVAGKAGSAAEG